MDAPAIDTQLPPAQVARAWKAAQDFEATALTQFLQPMFNTVDLSTGPMGGGSAEAQWQPMLVEAMAKKIESAGGLGIAAPVFRQMIQMQEARSHTS
jgi:Rod binding domain-containing protein